MATIEEHLQILREEMRERFENLSDNEKDIMRQNKGTAYERILRKVIGEDILGGQFTAPANVVTRRRGLATR